MPTQASRKSRNQKAKSHSADRNSSNTKIPAALDGYLDEINGAQSWKRVADILCNILDLPGIISTYVRVLQLREC